MADRPHDPAVHAAQALFGDLRQRIAVGLVTGFADREWMPFDRQSAAHCRRLHHLDAFRNHFQADVVAEQNSNFQFSIPAVRC
jgi:hypothetical protein